MTRHDRYPVRLLAWGIIASLIILLMMHTGNGRAGTDGDFRQRTHQKNQQDFGENNVSVEIRLGKEIAARILGKYPRLETQDLTRYVSLVGKSLALHSNRTEFDYHFAVLDTDHVNAYSTPGGYIFVTRGALELVKDEAELAAVLAHEIAHVTERHIVRELDIRDKDVSAAGSLGQLLGGAGGSANIAFMQVVDKATEILFETGYRQQDELDADRVGTLLLATTGYDPTSLQRYLNRVQAHNGESGQSINTTHPPSQERVEELARLIQGEGLDKGAYIVAQARFTGYVTTK